MTVFAEPCPWAVFISYIIYNWPRWSHIFWTYILSPQKVKVKHMFICKKKNPDQSCTASSFLAFYFTPSDCQLSGKKKGWCSSKIQTKVQISLQPLVYMKEFISLLHFDLLPENYHWKKKRLSEKYYQVTFQSNIPVPAVPAFKIRSFQANNLDLPILRALPFLVWL